MLKVLDLFAGEGGASFGYTEAGLSLLAAVDTDDKAMYRHWAHKQGLTFTGDWAEGLEKFGAEAVPDPCLAPVPALRGRPPRQTAGRTGLTWWYPCASRPCSLQESRS